MYNVLFVISYKEQYCPINWYNSKKSARDSSVHDILKRSVNMYDLCVYEYLENTCSNITVGHICIA